MPRFAAFLGLLCLTASLPAETWSQFRGPNATGIPPDSGYPTEFGPGKNMLWRTPAHPGKSSPVLTARHVFLTGHDKGKLYTQCFDRKTGKLVWEQAIDRARADPTHALNEPSSTSPVTDGDNVYVFFRDYGLISYDARGKLRWKTPLGPFANAEGASSSPIIASGRLFMVFDQAYDAYIAAFDLASGEIRWKTPRQEVVGWATPVLADNRILAAGSGRLSSYDPTTGKLVWVRDDLAPALVATPVVHNRRVYAFGYGFEQPLPWANAVKRYDKNNDGKIGPDEYDGSTNLYRIGKQQGNRDGFVTQEEWDESTKAMIRPSSLVALDLNGAAAPAEHWRFQRSFIGVVPSPLYLDGLVYFVKNGGVFTALDAETGQQVKAARLPAPDNFFASLVADPAGIIYAVSEKGKVNVIKAGRDWEVIRTNDLGEDAHGTPALSERKIYLRTNAALYCFASPQ